MIRFEERLARTVAQVLGLALVAGCGDSEPSEKRLEEMCTDPSGAPDGYSLQIGYVEIEVGGTCPDPADATLAINGCTFFEWQGVTCALDRVERDQVFVNDCYGGYHTDADNVPTYSGCGDVEGPMDVCYYEGVFYRPDTYPVCGRPLLREGRPVVAPIAAGTSPWASAPSPAADALDPADRAAVAAWWLEAATLEHASIASFARFSLDLMRLGAPPDLLLGAHRAAVDEIAHAQLCFALASAYRGHPVHPGPLDPTADPLPTRADVAEAVVREGCIGETLAAVDAAARLAEARDPAVRAALEQIVRDESEHAALAWRALAWLLTGDDGTVTARLAATFDAERRRWTAPQAAGRPVTAAARAHGLIDDATRVAAVRRAWDAVIAPSWSALVARP